MSNSTSTTSARTECLVLASFFLLALMAQFSLYADYDLWWHLALGRSIVETGGLYFNDTFTYTFNGQPQFTAEWLADLIIYLSHAAGGLYGIYALKSFVILSALYLAHRTVRIHTREQALPWLVSALTLLLVLFAIRFRLFVRPFIFSYLALSAYLYLLSMYCATGDRRPLYALPFIQLAWANMYSASAIGPMLLAFMIADRLMHRGFRHHARSLVIMLALATAASLASPEGFNSYLQVLGAATAGKVQGFGEFQPLTADILWGYGIRYTFAFQIMAVLCVIYLTFGGGWRRPFHVLLFLLFMVESVRHVRMTAWFSVACAPMAAMGLGYIFNRMKALARIDTAPARAAVAIAIIALIPTTIFMSRTYAFGIGIKKNAFPDGALGFLDDNNITGRMFNSYSFGGYLIWNAPPEKGLHRWPLQPHVHRGLSHALRKRDQGSGLLVKGRRGVEHGLRALRIRQVEPEVPFPPGVQP